MFKNIKDIKMIQSVSGPMQCVELKCAAVMDELRAMSPKERGERKKEEHKMKMERTRKEVEERAKREEERTRKKQESVRKEEEEQARKKEERLWKEEEEHAMKEECAKMMVKRCSTKEERAKMVECMKRKERESAKKEECREKRKKEETKREESTKKRKEEELTRGRESRWSDTERSLFYQMKYGWGNWGLIESYNEISSRNRSQIQSFGNIIRKSQPQVYNQLLLDHVARGRVALSAIKNTI